MHGLVNRAIQCFVTDVYGHARWEDVRLTAAPGQATFGALDRQDDGVTLALIAAAASALDKPRDQLLEDIGTYLVSHPRREGLRRLLRFGGTTFAEFLDSLDELPDRARLAVADLDLPQMEVRAHPGGRCTLVCHGPIAGWGHVMVGVLRAMADDYGALVLLEHLGGQGGRERVSILLLDDRFAAGRRFALAAGA